MTNSEIYREWKQAKEPEEQVGILADMEFNSKKKPVAEAITEQCKANGEAVPLYIKRLAGADIGEDLRTLVERGASRAQIAEELGVTKTTVDNMLKKYGLKAKDGRKFSDATAEIPENPKPRETSTAAEMAAVIVEFAAQLGKGEVYLSTFPDGSVSIVWKLEANDDEQA